MGSNLSSVIFLLCDLRQITSGPCASAYEMKHLPLPARVVGRITLKEKLYVKCCPGLMTLHAGGTTA